VTESDLPRPAGLALAYYARYRGRLLLDDAHLAKLRPGQRGAVFAMRSWATATPPDEVAILGLPTGYGKSELIALAPFLFGSRRILIIAPSVVVRHQLFERVRDQTHLRNLGIVPGDVPKPDVLEHVGRIEDSEQWKEFESRHVVVTHTQSVSPEGKTVADPPYDGLFDLILFDEAHHLGAPSWVGVREAFPNAIAVGFTATPYRRDRRALPGRTIFQYPLDKAVDEGFFVPIVYRQVQADATADGRDRAVAIEAIRELNQRNARAGKPAARLLVRADTVDRAKQLAKLYLTLDASVKLEVVTYETTDRQLNAATARLRFGESSGVAFVGVLGEGFDMPSLKIAAYHNPHRSLPVTIQFAGRVARTEKPDQEMPAADEHAVLIATSNDHPEILGELHRDGQRWDKLIPELARELDERPVRAWSVFSPSTANMADAFTVENFRTFTLADVYRLETRPDAETLSGKLAELAVERPGDRAYSVKVLQEGDCFAVLLVREHDLPWLEEMPDAHADYEHLVFALHKRGTDDSWWLCLRSTLPDRMTWRAIVEVFGDAIAVPLRTELARYRCDLWPGARFTGLGKRAIHPVVAGVMSYETGAGRSVDRALTLDDRALHEAGHAIGVAAVENSLSDAIQIGIAMNKRRVWQVGYARLSHYYDWTKTVCDDLGASTTIRQLGGLQIADSPLKPAAKPIAAMFDPGFDPTWDAEYNDGAGALPVRDLELSPMSRKAGADIRIGLRIGTKTATTITYSPDGQLLTAPGKLSRHGRVDDLHDRLRRFPLSVFFNDGSVMRGPGGCITPLDDTSYFPISRQAQKLTPRATEINSANRFAVLDSASVLLPEKDATKMTAILQGVTGVTRATNPTSLFQYVVRLAVIERADFIFCDDTKNEVADFVVAWRAHKTTGAPHVRLVHCKAIKKDERKRLTDGGTGIKGSGIAEAEEISQQALRSVSFLMLPPNAMVAKLEQRAQRYPDRFVAGTKETFELILATEPLARTADVWMVHPALSHSRLTSGTGASVRALLSSIRVRAVDARADLAVIGRP
jgi:superfamily II DNA or RNA helicase